MSTGDKISIFVLGRIQCITDTGTLPPEIKIYVTDVDGKDQPYANTAMNHGQHFCMVRTPSMGRSFMLVEYPEMKKILKATDLPIGDSNTGTKLLVEELDTALISDGQLPRDFGFGNEYWFSLVLKGSYGPPDNKTPYYLIFSDNSYRRVIQTGIGNTAGKEDAAILMDTFYNVPYECFIFEHSPPAELTQK